MTTITASAVISAVDKTGGVFEKIAGKFKAISQSAQTFGNMKPMAGWGASFQREIATMKASSKELEIVRRSWESFNAALKASGSIPKSVGHVNALSEWRSRTLSDLRTVRASMEQTERAQSRLMRSGARFAARAIGVGGAAHLANRGVRATVSSGANSAREDSRDYLAGLSEDESKRLKGRALDVSSRFNSVDANTMHEQLRETATSMRSVDKASALGDTIAQGMVMLQSLKGKDRAGGEMREFFKGLDTTNRNQDPARVRALLDGYIRALGVEGNDLNMGGLKTMARQSRAAGGALSDRFMMTTGVGLQTDMGDSQVGTALATSMRQLVAGRGTKASKQYQQNLGLRDKKGKLIDAEMAMQNPDFYAWNKIVPALQKKGIDTSSETSVAQAMSDFFSDRTAADMFTKLISQQQQYQGKVQQYEKAPGLAAAKELPGRDPFVAAEGFVAQLRNLAGTLSDPVFPAAAKALASVSSTIGEFTKDFSNDDTAGKVGKGLAVGVGATGVAAGGLMAGKAAYQWLTGTTALNGSAALLNQSAAALTGAAAKLAGMGGNVPSATVPGKTSAATPAKGSIWTRIADKASGAWPVVAGAVPFLGSAAAPIALLGGIGVAASLFPDDEASAGSRRGRGRDVRDAYRKRFADDRARFPAAGEAPEVTPTMTYGFGGSRLDAIRAASKPTESVKAEIEGNATLTSTMTISPSPYFMTTIDQKIDNKINAFRSSNVTSSGTSGSTGRSSPDAGVSQ